VREGGRERGREGGREGVLGGVGGRRKRRREQERKRESVDGCGLWQWVGCTTHTVLPTVDVHGVRVHVRRT